MVPAAPAPFALNLSSEDPWRNLALWLAKPVLSRTLRLPKLNALYAQAKALPEDEPFLERCLQVLNISLDVQRGEVAAIPSQGPLVAIANHPYGGIEGLVLASLLKRARPDVKLLANSMLASIPELRDLFFFVDPFGGEGSVQRNLASIRGAMQWVQQGHCLGVFPAGEVSSLKLSSRTVADPAWNPAVGRIVQRTGATAMPVFFDGRNSAAFQIAGLAHSRLRTLMLPGEMLRRRGRRVPIYLGKPIPPLRLAKLSDAKRATDYLRVRTYLLRPEGKAVAPGVVDTERYAPIADPIDPAVLAAELAALPARRTIVEGNGLSVTLIKPGEAPSILQEIGRSREIAFRGVGEGSGLARDLDRFDRHYMQLVLWDPAQQRIAGGYRLALTDQVIARYGIDGLYTHTLFDFNRKLMREIGPAVELGRSFVHPDYQKSFAPLMLLWRGVAQYIGRHPRYRKVLGPVSISAEYSSMSKVLLRAFLEASRSLPSLSRLLRPRHPMRGHRPRGYDPAQFSSVAHSVEEVSAIVSELEADGKAMPVLLRQYLKMGCKLLGFNVDPEFGNVVDGLALVDLIDTEPTVLARYMTREGVEKFRRFHGADV